MNITLTLGWWMIPAFLPAIFCLYMMFDRIKTKDPRAIAWFIEATVLFLCSLLTRYL